MDMILQDRYGGCYSGAKWLLIESYYKNLTQEELDLVNPHIADTDKFYGDMWAKYGYGERDNTLNLENTRLDLVECTLQGSDCYAFLPYDKLSWLHRYNTLEEISKVVEEKEEARYKKAVEVIDKLLPIDEEADKEFDKLMTKARKKSSLENDEADKVVESVISEKMEEEGELPWDDE